MLRKILITGGLLLLSGLNSSVLQAAFWQDIDATPIAAAARAAGPNPYARHYRLDETALRSALAGSSALSAVRLPLPMPDGSLAEYDVYDSPVMAPDLASRYPEIRTYRVRGEAGAVGRISMTPHGFQGMLYTPNGRVMITPRDFRSGDAVYRSGFTADEPRRPFNCGVHSHSEDLGDWVVVGKNGRKTGTRVTGSLQQYEIAVAATLEYFTFFGNRTSTTTAIVNTLNAVNVIYERDLGIILVLAAGADQIYEEVESGLLDNNDVFQLLLNSDDWIDGRLPGGQAAYDVGHMFAAPAVGGGGVAFLGAVCKNAIKGGGVSSISDPSIGAAFDIDLVAHEIGHQFNAGHSFNGTTSACLGNRAARTAVEPGSGSTIMAYAGICGAENLQSNSDATFHARNIRQIFNYTTSTEGSGCVTLVDTTPIGNADPVVTTPLSNYLIPVNTPFVLDVAATDTEMLSYSWDQMDAGSKTDDASFGTDRGDNSLFRSYEPRPESWRNFPALGTQVQGRYDKAEVMSCQDRALNFRVTVRDGVSGQATDNTLLRVRESAGPFELRNLKTAMTVFAGTAFNVNWKVANTNKAPINCANVDIDLLTFAPGFSSYTITPILAMTPNDGSESVTILPATANHPLARIRVKCSDNVFYALSEGDLTVTESMAPADPPLSDSDNITRFFANIGITSLTAPDCGKRDDRDEQISRLPDDSTAVDIHWLFALAGVIGLVRLLRRRYGLQ